MVAAKGFAARASRRAALQRRAAVWPLRAGVSEESIGVVPLSLDEDRGCPPHRPVCQPLPPRTCPPGLASRVRLEGRSHHAQTLARGQRNQSLNHVTATVMSMVKSTDSRCWRGCAETGALAPAARGGRCGRWSGGASKSCAWDYCGTRRFHVYVYVPENRRPDAR